MGPFLSGSLIELVYTARQLYGITLLVGLFCLTASWWQAIRPLTIFKRYLTTLHQSCMVDHHISLPWLSFFLESANLPICPENSLVHLYWSHSAVSHRCMQITILNQSGGHANQYPAYNYRQVSNIRRTKSQHLKDSRTVLWLSLPNPLKPNVKSRMKM